MIPSSKANGQFGSGENNNSEKFFKHDIDEKKFFFFFALEELVVYILYFQFFVDCIMLGKKMTQS